MSWMNSAWKYRHPVAVNKQTAGTAAEDVSIVIPSDWPQFWDNVKAAGADIRVCGADGVTLLTYDLNGFNATTKVCTVEVDNWTPPAANSTPLIWLYWGNSAAVDATTPFVPVSARTGSVWHYLPTSPIIRALAEPPSSTKPRVRLSKTSYEIARVWWNLQGLLSSRAEPHEGTLDAEEVSWVGYGVESGASEQASEMDESLTRYALDSTGALFVSTLIKAGSSGADRTISLQVGTTDGRQLNPRTWIQVRDVSEQ